MCKLLNGEGGGDLGLSKMQYRWTDRRTMGHTQLDMSKNRQGQGGISRQQTLRTQTTGKTKPKVHAVGSKGFNWKGRTGLLGWKWKEYFSRN